jgi:hypothetical protein
MGVRTWQISYSQFKQFERECAKIWRKVLWKTEVRHGKTKSR